MHVEGIEVAILARDGGGDYISLTDLARYKSDNPKMTIQNWMRNRNTLEFLGTWEKLNNPKFKGIEFDAFKEQAGLNSFVLTPTKWIGTTGAIGIRTKRGRIGGGTFAHVDIAFEFASWISPEFKLFVIQDYQRLKADETSRLSLQWNERRLFSKMNYRTHTDAVKKALITEGTRRDYASVVYATEADVLNVAVFGMTAKEWREGNPELDGNIRDNANVRQLLVLANLESMNAELLHQGKSRAERAEYLAGMAKRQFASLDANPTVRRLEHAADESEDAAQSNRPE